MRKPKFLGRIYYSEDWNGHGEYFVFECKWSDEKDWSLDTAFKLTDDKISYQALTKVREWMRIGIEFSFVFDPYAKEA